MEKRDLYNENKELTGKVRVILDIAGYREKRKKVFLFFTEFVEKRKLL